MPNYTAKNALPYPLLTEPPDGPAAFQALAERIEQVWAVPRPAAVLKAKDVQSIPANSNVQIFYQTPLVNSGGMADLPNGRLVAPVAGIYTIVGQLAFQYVASNGTYRRANLKVGATDVNFHAVDAATANSLPTTVQCTWTGLCAAGDPITLFAFQNHSAAIGTVIQPYYCSLAGWLVHAT
ncbi:hypothetical protein AB0P21_09790 [Kribbella sp. NPDC056861]|uniref:hypothetical protein n=1 Tax=Kribbella sp. NPDC056861 TaxID=3154857 RepID=UPI003414DB9E